MTNIFCAQEIEQCHFHPICSIFIVKCQSCTFLGEGGTVVTDLPSAVGSLVSDPRKEKLQFETGAGPKTMLVCRRPGPTGKQVQSIFIVTGAVLSLTMVL